MVKPEVVAIGGRRCGHHGSTRLVSRLGGNSTVSESSFRTRAREIAVYLYSMKLAYSTRFFRLYPWDVTPRGAPVKWKDPPRPIGSRRATGEAVAMGFGRLQPWVRVRSRVVSRLLQRNALVYAVVLCATPAVPEAAAERWGHSYGAVGR